MKSLRYLAVLPLMAAASQALTFDLQLGYGKPNAPLNTGVAADNTSVVGIGIGTYLTENSHLGLNVSTRDIVTADPVDASARTAIVEYTYELNSTGGIKPFIGAGIGYGWLTNTVKSSALATDVFAGMRFEVTESVDFTLTARLHQLHGVDFANVVGEENRQVNSFEAVAGLRFKF
ncbi:MAG: porin family protein [Opitutales bacterium]|jgi:opacity protein-like surface antigen|nr:porin family protein [Opitutales bacterium]MDP4658142.1 porin family protein [Opitutales bacterium]MDP4775197.1 porin family protein [Opitutales bacterium]MDP4786988.1 porin family protein [Opitutales bacterium]MDP4860431.1 porin family protein [Opitutales bacterium]